MTVHMDRKVWELFSECSYQKSGCIWSHESSHILNAKNMKAVINKLSCQINVILKCVLRVLVKNISSIADSCLNNSSSLLDGVNSKLEIFDIVKRVENSENIDSFFYSL